MINFGTVRPGTTLYVPFATYDSNDPSASVTLTGLAVTDIEIYKDGSVTQRASDAGYTLLDTDGIDFDGTTGIHGFSIDTADNTTANFWEAGSQYMVVVASVTVDGATVNHLAAVFRLGYEGALLDTTIATLASQTSFTLEEGSADNDAYNGCTAIIHDLASAVQIAIGHVSDYVGSTKTVTLKADPGIFTMAAGDSISVLPPPLTASQESDVTAIESELILVHSETTVIQSDTTAIHSDTTIIASDVVQIYSDTTVIASDVVVLDNAVSDVESSLVIVKSDLVMVASDTAAIHSDTTIIASDVVVLDNAVSDVESSLVIVKSDLVIITSDTTAIHSDTTIIASDVVIVVSDTTAIHSQTTVIESDSIVIQSDVALLFSAHSEPTGVPAANESPVDKLGYLFMVMRNKKTVTSTKQTIFGDDDAGEWEHDLTDDGTTTTVSEANVI